jgi:RNA polymerase sigma-70 factor (ECF subfamily)
VIAPDDAERETLARAARGDRQAFAALVRTYGKQLAKLAGSYGVATSEIEDVVQDAFIAAWRSLDTVDTERPFKFWLYQILLNKARDWRRRRRVKAFFFHAAALDAAESLPSTAPSAEDQAHDRQALMRVNAALAAIPDHLKRPLLLTSVGGLSRGEAAGLLGVSIKTLDGRVTRARTHLQALLAEQGNAGG